MKEGTAKRALVIYHANCDDGFGAAWAFHQLKEQEYETENVIYCPEKYGKFFPIPPYSKNMDVFILDFSYPYEILSAVSSEFKSITQLDHHKSAYLDFQKIFPIAHGHWRQVQANIEWQWDMDRSGAMMTWNYFAPHSEPPELIIHIQDNDLWKFDLPHTKYFISALRSYPQTFEVWDALDLDFTNIGSTRYHDFCDEGRTIQRYYNQQLQQALDATKRKIVIDGQEGLVANLPVQYASDAGNILAKESGTFGATYYTNSSGDTVFSLRSIGEFDVSILAKKFGGGGHKNASGFKLFSPIESTQTGITLWSIHPHNGEILGGPNG